jgi:hypothetical protein
MSETQEKHVRNVVHVRVAAPELIVETVATQIGELLMKTGYELIEQSRVYPNREGRDEARVYLIVR